MDSTDSFLLLYRLAPSVAAATLNAFPLCYDLLGNRHINRDLACILSDMAVTCAVNAEARAFIASGKSVAPKEPGLYLERTNEVHGNFQVQGNLNLRTPCSWSQYCWPLYMNFRLPKDAFRILLSDTVKMTHSCIPRGN